MLKHESIRPHCPFSLEDARRIIGEFVGHYNSVRLNSAIDYIASKAKLEGREKEIFKKRDKKLETARERLREKHNTERLKLVKQTLQGT